MVTKIHKIAPNIPTHNFQRRQGVAKQISKLIPMNFFLPNPKGGLVIVKLMVLKDKTFYKHVCLASKTNTIFQALPTDGRNTGARVRAWT